MATFKQRLERLELNKTTINNDSNLIMILVKDGESEQDSIVRSGYEHNRDLSKFLYIKLVAMQNEI